MIRHAAVALALLCTGAAPTGEVAIRVVAPDGRPAAGAVVHVAELDQQHFPDDPAPPPATVTADPAGVARLTWPAGATRLRVAADGVGYGDTGLMEVVAGRTVDAPLPPLAAFAVVDGTVPPDLVEPGTTVHLGGSYDEPPADLPVDAAGHFHGTVRAGRLFASAVRNGKRIAEADRPVDAVWGRTSTLTLRGLTPEQARQRNDPQTTGRELPAEQTITWAAGTVRDAAGRPVAGATVYAAAIFYGGIRMYQAAESATTDADGRYAVRGKGGLNLFSATLVVVAPGHPPAFDAVTLPGPGWAPVPAGATRPTTRFETPPAPVRDFTLADHGGGLDVVATVDGRPAAGAVVGLWRSGGQLRSQWAAPTGGPTEQAVEAIAYPQATAGPDGVAHFAALVPGTYEVVATVAGNRQTVTQLQANIWPAADPKPSAVAEAVAVRDGVTTRQTMALHPQANAASLKLLRTDGMPMADATAFTFGPVTGRYGTSTSIPVDTDGVGRYTFNGPGLVRVSAQYHHGPSRSFPLTPPFFAADAVVAASPLLAVREPPAVTAVWQEPAVVEVDVRDATGRPTPATVTVGSGVGTPFEVASTGPTGHVTLAGVRQRADFRVAGRPAGDSLPDLGNDGYGPGGPLPDDAALRGHTFVPAEPLDAPPLAHVRVTLSAVPAGYVRGRLTPPPGHVAKEYTLYLRPADDRGATVYLRPATGDYVAGPFPPGEAHVLAGKFGGGPLLDRAVTVPAGDVVRADLTPPPPPAEAPDGGLLIGVGGAERSPADTADVWAGRTVVLADAVTPAYGAEVLLVEPGRAEPSAAASADAAGRLHGRNGWRSAMAQPADPGGSPTEPVVVAWLPGAVGGAVVAPAGATRIVLPPAVSAAGTVTVGGRPPAGLHGRLRVLAEYQGRGKLAAYLSVRATPQDDGTFALPGLTPGTYRVQAAVDGIWLSETTTVTVAAAPVGPLTLDIPSPGGPVAVHVTDAAGRPAVHVPVTVDRPAGPLTDLCWPPAFTTDGAGVAVIPALEVGRHVVHAGGRSAEVTAPPATCDRAAAIAVQLP